MKLLFYSGGIARANTQIDDAMMDFLSAIKKPTISYIPADSTHGPLDYYHFVRSYKKLKTNRFFYAPIDTPKPLDNSFKEALFQSDLIYLSGGNTFHFLHFLKKNKLMNPLIKYAKNGGIIAGMSAGAIIMTPTIKMAMYPVFDRDSNDIGLRDMKALNLVPFDFYPHFNATKKYINALADLSKKRTTPIYAACDGSGIVIKDNAVEFIGDVYGFINKQNFKI